MNPMNPNQAEMPEDQVKLLAQMEEMVVDTFNRMRKSCTAKCTKPNVNEVDIMKNEAVCIDRCVAKYMELHDIFGKRIARDKETYDLLASRPYEEDSKS